LLPAPITSDLGVWALVVLLMTVAVAVSGAMTGQRPAADQQWRPGALWAVLLAAAAVLSVFSSGAGAWIVVLGLLVALGLPATRIVARRMARTAPTGRTARCTDPGRASGTGSPVRTRRRSDHPPTCTAPPAHAAPVPAATVGAATGSLFLGSLGAAMNAPTTLIAGMLAAPLAAAVVWGLAWAAVQMLSPLLSDASDPENMRAP
jgi:protein-S-isoprenylcysteine O-methyltransferase Ste14